MSQPEVTVEDVYSARERIRPHVHRTPLAHSKTLSEMTGTDLWLKLENLQKTGSFKVRGATNAVLSLSLEQLRHGLITASAGNHGAALAYAARIVGAPATVAVPNTAMKSKIAAIESYGAEVALVDGSRLLECAQDIQSREGQYFLHPFEHPMVVAGQGTGGLEILEDLPDVEVIVVPVGGGGQVSGIATALRSKVQQLVIVGVEPERSNVVTQSLASGHPLSLQNFASVADGLNAPWSGPLTLDIIQRLVDEMVTVSDQDILRAMALIFERTKFVVEPSGAAGVAALLADKVPQARGKKTVAVLSGGNVDLSRLGELLGARSTVTA